MLVQSRCAAIFVFALALPLASSATADITWNVTYADLTDTTGFGFDDPTHGVDRRSTFGQVLSYINTVIDADGQVDFTVNQSINVANQTLASAGTFYFTGPNGFSNGIVFQHATTGVDVLGSMDEGFATFNFNHNWNSQTDATAAGEFDLFTVALHEVSHALGFASLVTSTGISAINDTNPGVYSVFDSFLELGDGTNLFAAGGDFVGDPGDLTSDDVFFAGAAAVAANGGNPVKIYAPGVYDPGSSISHVDTATYPDAVMAHAIAAGVEKRTYSAIDRAILSDIGYTLKATAVPEPGGVVLLAVIASAVAVGRRRRKRGACDAAARLGG